MRKTNKVINENEKNVEKLQTGKHFTKFVDEPQMNALNQERVDDNFQYKRSVFRLYSKPRDFKATYGYDNKTSFKSKVKNIKNENK